MYPRNLVALSTLLVGGHCLAATPVASITSSANLMINGIAVPANRVSWPVSVNDEIVTQSGTARLRFADGSTVTLQRNSRARIESASSRVEVKMLSGSAIYDVRKPSALMVNAVPLQEASLPAPSAAPRQAAAVPYRMATASGSGASIVVAPNAVSSGSFVSAATRNAVVDGPTGTYIRLPGGTHLELGAPDSDGAYPIKGVVVSVETDGDYVFVRTTNSSLVGATLKATNIGTEGNQARIKVTTEDGDTLTDTELGTAIANAASTAFKESAGQLPPGTEQPSTQSAVSRGRFDRTDVVSPPGT